MGRRHGAGSWHHVPSRGYVCHCVMGGHELLSPGHPLSALRAGGSPSSQEAPSAPWDLPLRQNPAKGRGLGAEIPLESAWGLQAKPKPLSGFPCMAQMLKPSLLTFLPGERPCFSLTHYFLEKDEELESE